MAADDLVAIVQTREQGVALEDRDGVPQIWSDGRPVAYEFAIMELLVEIRDLMRDLVKAAKKD